MGTRRAERFCPAPGRRPDGRRPRPPLRRRRASAPSGPATCSTPAAPPRRSSASSPRRSPASRSPQRVRAGSPSAGTCAPGRQALLGAVWSGLALREVLDALGVGQRGRGELDAGALATAAGDAACASSTTFTAFDRSAPAPARRRPTERRSRRVGARRRRGRSACWPTSRRSPARRGGSWSRAAGRRQAGGPSKASASGRSSIAPRSSRPVPRRRARCGGVAAGLFEGVDDAPRPDPGAAGGELACRAAAGGARHRQELRSRQRAAGRRLHRLPGRGRRPDRRQRRRQEHAGQDALRRHRPDGGEIRFEGRRSRSPARSRRASSASRPSTRTSRSRPTSTPPPTCSWAAS